VVDNDPKQELKLADDIFQSVNLLRTGGSLGFASANNFAVKECRRSHHDFILLLNNDTIVEESAIDKLLSTFTDASVGAAGPCMPFADDPARIWACGGYINKLRVKVGGHKFTASDCITDVDYLPGTAILCKSEAWDLVGGLSEKYFLAYEEAEFALRLKKLGLRTVVNPRATILHQVGMSSDQQPMYIYNSVRNRIRFAQYLYGQFGGFIIGVGNTLLSSRTPKKLQLWVIAVKHELSNKPLNRDMLLKIKNDYIA